MVPKAVKMSMTYKWRGPKSPWSIDRETSNASWTSVIRSFGCRLRPLKPNGKAPVKMWSEVQPPRSLQGLNEVILWDTASTLVLPYYSFPPARARNVIWGSWIPALVAWAWLTAVLHRAVSSRFAMKATLFWISGTAWCNRTLPVTGPLGSGSPWLGCKSSSPPPRKTTCINGGIRYWGQWLQRWRFRVRLNLWTFVFMLHWRRLKLWMWVQVYPWIPWSHPQGPQAPNLGSTSLVLIPPSVWRGLMQRNSLMSCI